MFTVDEGHVRRFCVTDTDEQIAYRVPWATVADRLWKEDWIESTDGPNPAFPGIWIEVDSECLLTDDQIKTALRRIVGPYIGQAKSAKSKKQPLRNLYYG